MTAKDISDSIKSDLKAEVKRNQIELNQPIKYLGVHAEDVIIHGNVTAKVNVNVARTKDEAKEQEKIGRELFQEDDEYDRACFEANCGNIDIALELLKVGLEKNQVTKKWAKNDPDFENIRDDPRFKELVGE